MESLAAGLQSTVPTQVFTAGEYSPIPVAQRREVLLELSKNADPNVRGNVWRVYTTVATKEDLTTLREAFESQYSDVKMAALETMARLPNDETIGVLTKLLEKPITGSSPPGCSPRSGRLARTPYCRTQPRQSRHSPRRLGRFGPCRQPQKRAGPGATDDAAAISEGRVPEAVAGTVTRTAEEIVSYDLGRFGL